jgi:hypothetical protein
LNIDHEPAERVNPAVCGFNGIRIVAVDPAPAQLVVHLQCHGVAGPQGLVGDTITTGKLETDLGAELNL